MSEAMAPEARRAQLLRVSFELFGERGYHATTIADIIERAGVARGTFYNYFESKRQIFGVLLDELFTAATSAILPISTGAAADMHRQVFENIAALCKTLHDNLPMTRVLLEQAVGLDEEANLQLRAFYERALARLQKAIEDGQRLGIVRAGDSAVLATCMLGMIKEAVYQQLLGTQESNINDQVGEIFAVAARGFLAVPT